MPELEVRSLSKIEGVTLEGNPADRQELNRYLAVTLPIAAALALKAATEPGTSKIALAAGAALQSVAAMMSAAQAMCNLDAPPRDIETKVDNDGNLIYRCQHSPAHKWDLNGRKLP